MQNEMKSNGKQRNVNARRREKYAREYIPFVQSDHVRLSVYFFFIFLFPSIQEDKKKHVHEVIPHPRLSTEMGNKYIVRVRRAKIS